MLIAIARWANSTPVTMPVKSNRLAKRTTQKLGSSSSIAALNIGLGGV